MRRSNLAFESQHLLHALEAANVKNWVSLSEGQQGSLGWLTTNERKEQMCLLLREAMNVGKIALSDCFFSTELGDREARQRIKDELSSYCVVSEAPKTTFGKFRKVRSPLLLPRTTACQLWSLVCADLHGQALRKARRPLHCASACHDRLPKGIGKSSNCATRVHS